MATFAALTDCITLYSFENGGYVSTATHKFPGDSSGVRGNTVNWTKNGKWLTGAASTSGSLPILKYEDKKLSPGRFVKDPDISSAVCFNWTNHYVAVGSKTGAVAIWETKSKKRFTTLAEKDISPVRFMSISEDDSQLAVSNLTDVIKIYGLTTNKLTSSLSLKSREEISGLRFSTCKKQYLGCSTMEGSVYVWDVYKSLPIMHSKGAHCGSITDIAMSNVNYFVVASVSLTNTLVLHDIRQKNPFFECKVDKPLTTVDISNDNVYLGSLDSHIFVFDLRKSKVDHDINLNGSRVRCVRAVPQIVSNKSHDTTLNTPDQKDVMEDTAEVSIADILSPFLQVNATVTPPLAERHLGNGTREEYLNALSPFMQSGCLIRSTPNQLATPKQATNETNELDSFLRQMASPVCQPSPIVPASSPALPNIEVSSKNFLTLSSAKGMVVKDAPKLEPLLQEILGTLKTLQADVRQIQQQQEIIKEDQLKLKDCVKDLGVDTFKSFEDLEFIFRYEFSRCRHNL